MRSTGVLASMCAGLFCLAAVHGAAENGLLQAPPNTSQLAHCRTSCGGVKISYPFGIGPGCFRQGFELICDRTDRPPRLLLGNSSIQMTYISVGNSTAGASTIGYNITMSPDNTETMERAGNVGGNCGGIGCCQIIDLERQLPTFTINLVRINSTRAEQDKALSKVKIFLSDDSYQFAVSDLFLSWVNTSNDLTSFFDFAFTDQLNCERAQLNKDSYPCNDESECIYLAYARGYYCVCPNGHDNPYVVDGCNIQDLKAHETIFCVLPVGIDLHQLSQRTTGPLTSRPDRGPSPRRGWWAPSRSL